MTAAPVPETVRRYARYLRHRGLDTGITVNGTSATVTAIRDGGELRIAFAPDGRTVNWRVTWMDVSRGGMVTAFSQGQVGAAVEALLKRQAAEGGAA